MKLQEPPPKSKNTVHETPLPLSRVCPSWHHSRRCRVMSRFRLSIRSSPVSEPVLQGQPRLPGRRSRPMPASRLGHLSSDLSRFSLGPGGFLAVQGKPTSPGQGSLVRQIQYPWIYLSCLHRDCGVSSLLTPPCPMPGRFTITTTRCIHDRPGPRQ